MRAISHFLKRLRANRSGNALVLVAAGMPALIGGAGFAVDMTQWYMWKSELQYAVDQAAIAGAYARTSEDTETLYEARAQQEFTLNLDRTAKLDTATDPVAVVSLEDWGTGTDNSVVVTASVTHSLPFSSFVTGKAATIGVSAQAAFEEGENFTSCLVAVDPDAEGAVTIGGSAEFIAGCGIAALSDDPNAITVNGSPTIDAGWLIARGGIDDWFNTNTDDVVREGVTDLYDPFGCEGEGACLTPPNNPTPRTYSCPKGKVTSSGYIADSVTTRTQITYAYYKKSGNNYNLQSGYTGTGYKPSSDTTTTANNVTLTAMPASTTVVTGPTAGNYDVVAGSGNNRIYERATATVTTTYVNPHLNETVEADGSAAVLEPGTYGDLTLKCDTVFTGGIYVIDGGMLEIHSQYDVTGAGVMFVLKNGAGIVINGGASVNLTAMTIPQLEAAGVSSSEAQKLAGMLIFEDPNSSGSTKNKLNGNATTILNGTVYLPVSNLDVRGSAGVTAQCLMLVASTVTLSGNVEMTSFCPPEMEEDTLVSSSKDRVRLVS